MLADRKRRAGGREVDVSRRYTHRRCAGSGIDLGVTGLLDDDVRGRVTRLYPREANESAVVVTAGDRQSRVAEASPEESAEGVGAPPVGTRATVGRIAGMHAAVSWIEERDARTGYTRALDDRTVRRRARDT